MVNIRKLFVLVYYTTASTGCTEDVFNVYNTKRNGMMRPRASRVAPPSSQGQFRVQLKMTFVIISFNATQSQL